MKAEDDKKNIQQFFEKETTDTKKSIKFKVFLVAGCIVVLFYAYSYLTKAKEATHHSVSDQTEIEQDERKNYSEEEIKKFVDLRMKQEKSSFEKTERQLPAFKRDLSKEIAIYIYKEEKRAEAPIKPEGNTIGISSGTQIKAYLTNDVFSYNIETPVIAITAEDYTKGEAILIPKKTRFLGQASIVKSYDRINVVFQRMVLPDGREIHIQAMALSMDGSGGIKGKVKNHKVEGVFKALAKTILGGVSLFAGTSSDNETITVQDQLLLNAAEGLTNQAQQQLGAMKVEESVSVEALTPIQILFLEAL